MDWWLDDFSDSVYMADGYRCDEFSRSRETLCLDSAETFFPSKAQNPKVLS